MIQGILERCGDIGQGKGIGWSYYAEVPKEHTNELIEKLDANGYVVQILDERSKRHKKSEDSEIEIQRVRIRHPAREADASFWYITMDFMNDLYYITRYSIKNESDQRYYEALISRLRTRGYVMNIFDAPCWHRAHCDNLPIKCAPKYVSDINLSVVGSHCSHQCDANCESGLFIKITHLDPMEAASLLFESIQKLKDLMLGYSIKEDFDHEIREPLDPKVRHCLIKMLEDASYIVEMFTKRCIHLDDENHLCNIECAKKYGKRIKITCKMSKAE